MPSLGVQFPIAEKGGALDFLLAVEQAEGGGDPFRCAAQGAGKIFFTHDHAARRVLLLHVASILRNFLRQRLQILLLHSRSPLWVPVIIPAQGGHGSDGARDERRAAPVCGQPRGSACEWVHAEIVIGGLLLAKVTEVLGRRLLRTATPVAIGCSICFMPKNYKEERTALLVRCSTGEADLIREAARAERRTVSGYILNALLQRIAVRERTKKHFEETFGASPRDSVAKKSKAQSSGT